VPRPWAYQETLGPPARRRNQSPDGAALPARHRTPARRGGSANRNRSGKTSWPGWPGPHSATGTDLVDTQQHAQAERQERTIGSQLALKLVINERLPGSSNGTTRSLRSANSAQVIDSFAAQALVRISAGKRALELGPFACMVLR
jgi:hypothetical protein